MYFLLEWTKFAFSYIIQQVQCKSSEKLLQFTLIRQPQLGIMAYRINIHASKSSIYSIDVIEAIINVRMFFVGTLTHITGP